QGNGNTQPGRPRGRRSHSRCSRRSRNINFSPGRVLQLAYARRENPSTAVRALFPLSSRLVLHTENGFRLPTEPVELFIARPVILRPQNRPVKPLPSLILVAQLPVRHGQ